MVIASPEFETEVWRLFDQIEPRLKEVTISWWKAKYGRDRAIIFTNEKIIDAAKDSVEYDVGIAATDGHAIYFRMNWIVDRKLDYRLVILHELAHCVYFATGEFDLIKYRLDENHKTRCEKTVEKKSREWFRKIKIADIACNHSLLNLEALIQDNA